MNRPKKDADNQEGKHREEVLEETFFTINPGCDDNQCHQNEDNGTFHIAYAKEIFKVFIHPDDKIPDATEKISDRNDSRTQGLHKTPSFHFFDTRLHIYYTTNYVKYQQIKASNPLRLLAFKINSLIIINQFQNTGHCKGTYSSPYTSYQ